ncbi:MAG TPA: tetratricopeptide repeat protein [Vicinamibacterales bacterium]|nr:tetratricopeptide repeat protein [Vicinamibacterales bacterium]
MARFSTSCLLIVPLVVSLVAANSAAAQKSAQDFERLLARAIELHNAGDVLGAIDSYTAALEILPDRADARSNLGAAYVRLGQYDDAIKQYELALKSDPASTAIRLNLALAYYKSARPNQAIPQLKRVVSSDPEAKGAYLLLADCYLQTGQAKEAASLLRPREQMFGNDLSFAYLLGTALVQMDETVEGQKYVDRVFGAGESAEAHLLMGTAFLARQDYPAARTELERAVKLNPKLPTAHSLYGRALFALGDQEAAERAFRKELELNVNDFEANLQLGNMRKSAQKFAEAETYLERATTIRPDDIAGRRLLANLRLQTGKTEDAVTILEGIVKDNPNLVDVHVQLATAYNRLKRKEDADRERAIIDRLNAEAQAKQPGSKPGGGGQP